MEQWSSTRIDAVMCRPSGRNSIPVFRKVSLHNDSMLAEFCDDLGGDGVVMKSYSICVWTNIL